MICISENEMNTRERFDSFFFTLAGSADYLEHLAREYF